MPATVLSIAPNGDAELSVRGMRVRVKASELDAARAPSRQERRAVERAAPAVTTNVSAPPTGITMQLDLRGMRADEASEALDRYLNDAYLAGNQVARIVHGKGTGAVRAAVRDQLARHPLVARFAAADQSQGGDGATEVTLAR
jgi:DNA mismatch repair protein MutS2